MPKPKNIESPELMWEYFTSYKKELEENPIYKVEQKKGNTSFKILASEGGDVKFDAPSDIVMLPNKRPLTLEGFENWCEDNEIINDLGDYFSNKDGRYSEYTTICSRIKRTIRQDQIEGGMVGIYNQSITQRLNGLADKKELDHNVKMNIPNLPDIGNRQ